MTAYDDFERDAGAWIREIAGTTRADYLEAVLERTRTTRQRPAWSSPSRWLPAQLADVRLAPEVRTLALVLALVALLVAATIALVGSGAFRRLPPPYGPAHNGLMAWDNNGIIYVAEADGSRPRAITDGTSFDQLPVWSPDGTKLAYVQAFAVPDMSAPDGWFAIYDVEHETKVSIRVPDDNNAYWGLSWSPDSRLIACAADYQLIPSLYVVNADGSGVRRIVLPDAMRAWYPAWSPDGRLIAFAGAAAARYAVWVIAPDGTALRRLTTPSVDQPWGIAWSPDGSRLVYLSSADSNEPRSLRVVNGDGSGDHAITDGTERVGMASWSPDGRLLAFVRAIGDVPAQLVVTFGDGTVERVLSSGRFTLAPPAWSPDGTKVLAYQDAGLGSGTGPSDLRLITADVGTGALATMPPLAGRPDASGYDGGVSTWQRVAP